eukprot:TRINITY_DN48823_c0_g1_i1.p1 TRINITY_DN48823_c0_g1~~TRINITY_DN48823_c0_g1_i1.p1  ORF type:complete len:343 (+),score=52.49 TRINITY_DN48823_c0_g1_i1:29-1030(+)
MDYQQLSGESLEDYAARLVELLRARDAELCILKGKTSQEVTRDVHDSIGGGDAGDGMEEAEALLEANSKEKQNPAVLQLLAGLQACAVYTDTPNHETNRKLWDAYAQNWKSDEDWVKRMSSHLPGPTRELSTVGDEWSDERSLDEVLNDWLIPLVRPQQVIAEIGSGGGRIAARVAGDAQRLVCFDISSQMLAAAKHRLQKGLGFQNVEFCEVAGDSPYPSEYNACFDVIYSFDVFVHMDIHQMRHTLSCIKSMLRPEGLCFLSFANLLAPAGWRRFSRQKQFTVGGFYFVSPDIVRCLLIRSGFEIVRVSEPSSENTYLNRDLLVLVKLSSK